MKWSIHQLQKLQHKGLTLDETIDMSGLKEHNREIIDVSPVHVKGRVDFSSSQIVFHLHVTGSLVLPCSRTLVEIQFPFDIQTTETFLLNADWLDGDGDFHTLEGDTLDLLPILEENILVEIPMQVFAEDVAEDAPRAPSKGQDWQVIEEVEKTEKVDPRLASLAKFFDKKD
jgi:uncharacterized protein